MSKKIYFGYILLMLRTRDAAGKPEGRQPFQGGKKKWHPAFLASKKDQS